MDFSWIKNIFKKKTNENINIATIDTSLTYIRELNQLSPIEKKKVLDYYKKINLNNYQELVKYSDDLSNLYILEQDVLEHTINRYNKDFEDANQMATEPFAMAKKMVSAQIAKEEYSIIVNNIYNIRKELEYRFIALNMFINKQDKPSFSKLFNKAEKLKYLSKKDSLYSERRRIQISIRNVDNVLVLITKCIKENANLEEKHQLLEKINSSLGKYNNEQFYSRLRIEIGEKLNHFIKLFDYSNLKKLFIEEIKKEIIDKIEIELKEKRNETKDLPKKVWADLDIEKLLMLKNNLSDFSIITTHELVNYIPSKYLDDLYKIIAKYLHQYEIYYYAHKNDYKIYIKEMSDIYNSYCCTPTKDWDIPSLSEKIDYYMKEKDIYFDIYKDYLKQDVIDKINDLIYRLAWLYSLVSKEAKMLFDDYDDNYNLVQNYIKYSDELLSKVETRFGIKLNVKPDVFVYGTNKRYHFLFENVGNRHISLLFDILNDYDDDVKICFRPSGTAGGLENGEYVPKFFYSLPDIIEEVHGKSTINYKYFISMMLDDPLPIEELIDILTFFDIKNYNLERCKKFIRGKHDYLEEPHFNHCLATIKINKYKNQCDERIDIIPKCVPSSWIYGYISKIESKEANIALFTKNTDAIEAFLSRKNFQDIYKYLFVEEGVLKEYNERERKHKRKPYDASTWKSITIRDQSQIIVVPDNTQYSELSERLDRILEQEDIKTKKLVS